MLLNRKKKFQSCPPVIRLFNKRGFSLIEVIIVLAVIIIMAGIATPIFLKWLPDIRLKSAARDVYSTMQKVRSLAVKENRTWAVIFDDGANDRYSICSDSGTGGWTDPDDNICGETISLTGYRSGVAFGHANATQDVPNNSTANWNISYANDVATFNPRGTGSTGYIYLTNEKNNNTYAIGTQTSGVIRLLHWVGNAWE